MFDDKKFILAKNWPHLYWLPMKRRNNSLEDRNLGILYVNDTRVIVYHAYLWDLPENWRQSEKTEYDSVDALLADGWRVD